MESSANFEIKVAIKDNWVEITAFGNYSLSNTLSLFRLAIDETLKTDKDNILIDVTTIEGVIPFIDRFQFSVFFSEYNAEHALDKGYKVAVVGNESIVDKQRFGQTVARNRGMNICVFEDIEKAILWLEKE